MKRILYVEGCRDGTVGGSHTCLFSMVVNLDRQRHHAVVVFYDDHGVAARLRSNGIETRIFRKYTPLDIGLKLKNVAPSLKKISWVLLPLQKSLNFVFYFLRPALLYAYYIKKHEIDIVHLNNSINSNHDWIVAAKLARVKIVSHERGINDKVFKTSIYLGNTIDLLICVSKAISYPLIKHGFSEAKIKLIYDGIDFSRIQVRIDPENIKSAYGLNNGDPVIGVVGNVKEWKGQETVIRATGILKKNWPGIKCLIVGGTIEGDSYKAKLDRIIVELQIGENVIFTGFQNNPADFLNVMDVVVHSSIQAEPFGMVNLEAMYMKKPVVATDMGGPREIFNDGEDGFLIEPGNPALLAQKISVLLDNPELRGRIGQRAHEEVMARFNISDTVRRIEECYEEIS